MNFLHPIRLRLDKTGQNIINDETMESIATVRQGFRFYMGHDHIHVCPEGWDGKRIAPSVPVDPRTLDAA